MLNFKQYINEEVDDHAMIDQTNTRLAELNVEKINHDLDLVTADPFVNSSIFMNAVRGTLERFGILLPANSVLPQLNDESEMCYTLGDSGYHIYIVHNAAPDGGVEGYAQLVDGDELADLATLSDDDDYDDTDGQTSKPFVPPARKDDDSGNTAEYA